MFLSEIIDNISDKGSLRVNVSLMKAISILCADMLKRSQRTDYNWDVISLYFTPENGVYEQKERYDAADTSSFLTAWSGMEGTTSSTTVARGLQGLEYILEMTREELSTGIDTLERDICAEYRSVGSPIDQ